MRKGLPLGSLANGMECNNDQAESDCMEVVEPCTGGEAWSETNGVAHELARSCFIDQIYCNWVDEPL
jgi:hypothetical protein